MATVRHLHVSAIIWPTISVHKFLYKSLTDFDVNVIDLGLSNDMKTCITVIKPDVRFALAEWKHDFPGRNNTPEYKKVFLYKPSIPNIFPGCEGSVWIDSGRTTGTSFDFETHPIYRSTQKVRKLEIFDKVIIEGTKDVSFSKIRKMFGARITSENGMQPMLNSGLFYIASGSPIWQAWQEATLDREN